MAEVRSRFEGKEGGVERFLEVTNRLGFDRRQIDRSNKMFLMAEFKKSGRRPENGVEFEAKVKGSIILMLCCWQPPLVLLADVAAGAMGSPIVLHLAYIILQTTNQKQKTRSPRMEGAVVTK